MNINGYFVTGTDTNVGKTYVSVKLIKRLREAGQQVIGVKPIASSDEDVLALKSASGVDCDLRLINPIRYSGEVAPHIGVASPARVTAKHLLELCQPVFSQPYDQFVVEGCGGWLVPLNESETMADFAKALGLPVLLVVKMQLGCLNHALLTYRSIKEAGLPIAGWVANTPGQPMLALEENIRTLKHWMRDAPFLGTDELEWLFAISDLEPDIRYPQVHYR